MTDFSHLDALEIRKAHETEYLAKEKSEQGKALRRVWIAQIEKEIAAERAKLGLDDVDQMSDDDLLRELGV